jgi:hypothetical protein
LMVERSIELVTDFPNSGAQEIKFKL